MEVALRRRLEGVAGISISQARQTAEVDFLPTPHAFSATAFRDAVGEADVEVVTLEVDVCGVIVQEQERRWLVAGPDRFLLANGQWAGERRVCLTGRLADRLDSVPLVIEAVLAIR
jgi:hypothetical protein